MSELLLILLGLVLINQFALAANFGALATLSAQARPQLSCIAIATGGVMLGTAALYFGIRELLTPLRVEYVHLLLLVAISGGVALLMSRFLAGLGTTARLLLTVNGSVLVLSLERANTGLSLWPAFVTAIGLAGAFGMLLLALTALCDRIDTEDVPESFRGAPIMLVTAGVAALALLGLSGLLPD